MVRFAFLLTFLSCFFSSCDNPFYKKPQVIFDAEMSPNDLMSLYLLSASPKAHLLGVTISTTKNSPFKEAAASATDVLMLAKEETIPVSAFASDPICSPDTTPSEWVSSEESLTIYHLPKSSATPLPMKGGECIDLWVSRTDKKVTLLCLGPLHNIARALIENPDIAKKIERIVMLGGSLHSLQTPVLPFSALWKTASLYNFVSDPCSAHTVISSGIPIFLIPLDVVALIPDTPDLLNKYSSIQPKTPGAEFVLSVIKNQASTQSARGLGVFWDMVGVMAIIRPNLLTFETMGVDVITEPGSMKGTLVPSTNGFLVNVCTRINQEKFFETVFRMVNE